jgi:glycosyltransferase involved in cell wall biosynthesis
MPNHPTGIVRPPYKGRLVMSESKDGLRILRSWSYVSPNRAGVRKLLGHLTFAATALILSGPRLRKTDVVIVSSPTFFVVFSAWITARLRRAKFVFEVRDLWPEVFVDLGALKPGRIFRVLQAFSRFLYRRADLVVVVTEPFRDRIIRQGIAATKVAVVSNGADIEWFKQDVHEAARARRRELGLDGRFTIGYVGAHGVSHGLMAVLRAAELSRNDPGICFLLVGDGSERGSLETYAREKGLTNVLMLPGQPPDSVREFYALSDACLVPLRDIALFETFVPSKMFEIMAAGRPIIGSVKGEARRILERSGSAVLIDPEAPEALVGAANELRRLTAAVRTEMGSRGQAFVAANYSRQALAAKYGALLAGLRP